MNEQHNPWQVINEQEIYSNNWISLKHYDVINPSGGSGIYGKVHFKNIAVGIIPLDKDLNTYVVGQFRFTLDQYSWEIPEGGCPLEEAPLHAAQRELQEETGLHAEYWTKILDLHLSSSVSDEYCVVYAATGLSQHESAPEDTEQLMIKKIPFGQLYQMVQDGKITDAISVAATLKIKLMLAENKLIL